jgi:hypothetical protein
MSIPPDLAQRARADVAKQLILIKKQKEHRKVESSRGSGNEAAKPETKK